MTNTLTRRQRRRAILVQTATPWSRTWRRALNRDEARKHPAHNGPEPRYEPARNDYCADHFRQLPCKRCTKAGAE